MAAALGVREVPGRPLAAMLADALKTRRTLLVLDNCEHLLHACARLAEMLLSACAGLRVLATSRQYKAIAERCMAEYDLYGWTAPDLINPDDVSLVRKKEG